MRLTYIKNKNKRNGNKNRKEKEKKKGNQAEMIELLFFRLIATKRIIYSKLKYVAWMLVSNICNMAANANTFTKFLMQDMLPAKNLFPNKVGTEC